MATETSTMNSSGNQQKVRLRAETSIDYNKEEYKYDDYLSRRTPGLQPPLQEFSHEDIGLRAASAKPTLLKAPDVGYEINGMGTSTFFVLSTSKSGGNTLYMSTTAAYDHVSDSFRESLHGLCAANSGLDQASVHDHRDRYIREPVGTEHPVVRLHPVIKKYSLYVNRLYTKRVVGWKREESGTLLNFLFDHIERDKTGIFACTGSQFCSESVQDKKGKHQETYDQADTDGGKAIPRAEGREETRPSPWD
ncbi:Taurine catabolism dioxygenase TauD/TfdA [Macrophomina phaseolina MS6]|uniref:Taurine catabolism dioxygenase TauD/TfdA n=1 Tax=Macrophomina phaseolina (strain MS6) TaxID=1126212 RepID=K2RAT0_MACPH|nr:Taurine catabolism dioxygenase TauD/TfdA [Macrophomina phaseolina MS6]